MLQMDSQGNLENLRVASFSAYLNSSDENFVLKIAGAIKDHSLDLDSGKIKADHEELDIFAADKYFDIRMEEDNKELIDYDKMIKAEMDKKLNTTRASSVFSEASSNSQRPLLSKLSRNPSLIRARSGNRRSFFMGLGCSRTCSDKKSVENGCVVHKKDHLRKESFRFANTIVFDEEKNCQKGLKGGDNFEFLVPKVGEVDLVTVQEPRHSIEVFGSTRNKKSDQMEMILERKLSMLTWDAIPKTQNQASTMGNGPFDDNQSDASSDLFELETLSGNVNTFLTNQESEKNTYCMSPTTQYAPSEASIEWSVVTASAADFSFASEYDEKSVAEKLISRKENMNIAERKEGQKRSSGLLSCKSHKAVSVAETAHKSADPAKSVIKGKPQGRAYKNDFEFAPIF